jgi:hypothetical protein
MRDLEFTADLGLRDTLGEHVGGPHSARFHPGDLDDRPGASVRV